MKSLIDIAEEIVILMYSQIENWEPKEAPEEDVRAVLEILEANVEVKK